MGFLTSLFGGGEDGISWWGAGFALIIVLVLIIAGLWALKLLFKASGSVARGRQRRLAVIDTLNVDAKRSLLLIRRDNVEHLLVIGGAQDVVVETGIATEVEAPIRTAPRKTPARREPAAHTESEAPERSRTAAASRLGLTGLLRRYNDPQTDNEPEVDTPEVSPLERLKNLGNPGGDRSGPALRHTGLLRPASNDDSDNDEQTNVEEPHIPAPSATDSVMNGQDHSDAGADASAEQEAAADDAETQSTATNSDGADEFAARSDDVTVASDEFAPEVTIDGDKREPQRDSDLDEDATEPPAPRTQH